MKKKLDAKSIRMLSDKNLQMTNDQLGLKGWSALPENIQLEAVNVADRVLNILEDQLEEALMESDASPFLNVFLSNKVKELTDENGLLKVGFININKLPDLTPVFEHISSLAQIVCKNKDIESATGITNERIQKCMRIRLRDNITYARDLKFIRQNGSLYSVNQIENMFHEANTFSIHIDDLKKPYQELIEEHESGTYEGPTQDLEPLDFDIDEITEESVTFIETNSSFNQEELVDAKTIIIKQLTSNGYEVPKPDFNEAYDELICILFELHEREYSKGEKKIDIIDQLRRKLDHATRKAVKIYKDLFDDLANHRLWLERKFPTVECLSESPEMGTLVEFDSFNFYEMLYAMFYGERREVIDEETLYIPLAPKDRFLAQAICHLTHLLFSLEKDETYEKASNREVNQWIEKSLNGFWAKISKNTTNKLTYYTSKLTNRVIQIREDEFHRKMHTKHPRRTRLLDKSDILDGANGVLPFWRYQTSPKQDTSTILKILTQNRAPINIPDLQRNEVVVGLTIHDLDINPNLPREQYLKNIENHVLLVELAKQHCRHLKLIDATTLQADEGINYQKDYHQIPPGTFVVVNKAEWNSSNPKPPQKAFLAVKAYFKVPVDYEGRMIENFNPEDYYLEGYELAENIHNKPVAYSIPREIRLIPMDLAHIAQDPESTLGHGNYKGDQAGFFAEQSTPYVELPEVLDMVNTMKTYKQLAYLREVYDIFGYETTEVELLESLK